MSNIAHRVPKSTSDLYMMLLLSSIIIAWKSIRCSKDNCVHVSACWLRDVVPHVGRHVAFGGDFVNIKKEYNLCNSSCHCKECPHIDFCSSWVSFIKNHGETKSYAHFDKRVSLAMPSIRRYVMSSENIVHHGFYPFIHFTKKSTRYGKKERKKLRDLYYCAHLDRCVYQRYAFLINHRYNQYAIEKEINKVAIAYRNNLGKNSIDYARDAFEAIQKYGQCFVFVGDFTNFFDRIQHAYLKKMLCAVLGTDKLPEDYYAVFKNITHFSSWDWKSIVAASGENITEPGIRTKINKKTTILTKEQFLSHKSEIVKNKSNIGIPQGSPISAVLSNVYMIQFDQEMKEFVAALGGTYMRYSDDFLLILPYVCFEDIESYLTNISEVVNSMHGLIDLQRDKTAYYIFKENTIYSYPSQEKSTLDYLGFIFNGGTAKIRPRAITKYYYRMRRKAHTIGRSNWTSPTGRHISAKKLYGIYAHREEGQTFIDYVKRAKRVLRLCDSESEALIKRHKHKIAQAIKEGQNLQKS